MKTRKIKEEKYCLIATSFRYLENSSSSRAWWTGKKKKRRPIKSSSHKSTEHRLNVRETYMQHMVMHWREDVISYVNLISGLQSWKGISTFLKHPCLSPFKTGDLILDSQDCIQPWCNKAERELVKELNWPLFCRCFLKPRFGVKGISLLKGFRNDWVVGESI